MEGITQEVENDITDILMRFDGFLDSMSDRGAFDCNDPEDKELDDFVNNMKSKYLKVEK